MLAQQIGGFLVPSLHRIIEGSFSAQSCGIHICPVYQKKFNNFLLA